jgi:hypothetical protein
MQCNINIKSYLSFMLCKAAVLLNECNISRITWVTMFMLIHTTLSSLMLHYIKSHTK